MKKIVYGFLLFLIGTSLFAQNITLTKSAPEAEGVSSDDILKFIDAVGEKNFEFHSFVLLRHGKIISEGWWNPYRPELKHTMYSTSKSFTATAVGFAITEKRISVKDKVISFFPEFLPKTVSPYLADLTIKDLLTMSAGIDPDPTFKVASRDSNWIKGFLALPIANKPGTKFLYNSLCTYMLSAIVQKVTGEKVIDYLKPRLFDPLEIKDLDWETDLRGINTGGWGLRLRTEDMAKFGQLFLQKGMWNGKQIIPASWIEEASTKKIDQAPDAPQAKKDSSDWMQGYCYQMWRCRHNAYRADGAFGQYIIVIPDDDAVIAITSETQDMQGELNLIWKYLLPAYHDGKLETDTKASIALTKKLNSLALSVPQNSITSSLEKNISNKTIKIEPDTNKLESLSFNFKGETCLLKLKSNKIVYDFTFDSNKWQDGITTMPGPDLLSKSKYSRKGISSFDVAGSYRWSDENTLELYLRYIESPHTEKFILKFDKQNVNITIHNSFENKSKDVVLKGEMD